MTYEIRKFHGGLMLQEDAVNPLRDYPPQSFRDCVLAEFGNNFKITRRVDDAKTTVIWVAVARRDA
jgi:hypothetical protein